MNDFIKTHEKYVGYAVIAAIISYFLIWPSYVFYFGSTQIGSLTEKSNYTAKYYVNLFPDKNLSKNYRIVADIERYSECESTDESGSNCYSNYYVRKLYWPNGGYFTFDDCPVEKDKVKHCYSEQGEDAEIELTNIQVSE